MGKHCRLYRSFGFFLAVLMLSACGSSTPTPVPIASYVVKNYNYGSAYMTTMNREVNDRQVIRLEQSMTHLGGRVISVGQEYKIVFPTDILFYPYSPRIMWESYGILNQVVEYLRLFNKEEVSIVVVTHCTGDPLRDRALSVSRAHNVEDYLWGQDTGAALMYSHGDVTNRSYEVSRIEINFRSVMK